LASYIVVLICYSTTVLYLSRSTLAGCKCEINLNVIVITGNSANFL